MYLGGEERSVLSAFPGPHGFIAGKGSEAGAWKGKFDSGNLGRGGERLGRNYSEL